jgi:hypothetical protein
MVHTARRDARDEIKQALGHFDGISIGSFQFAPKYNSGAAFPPRSCIRL